MSLADFKPARVPLIYRGKTLASVRGLNGQDCAVLIRGHVDDLRTVFRMLDASGTGKLLPTGPDIETVIFNVVNNLPNFTAKVIALAADEDENEENARLLPMPLQISVVIDIVKLTFEDVGGPLAFAGMLRQLVTTLPSMDSGRAIPSLISTATSGSA